MGPALILPVMMVLLLGPSLVPGSGGRKKPPAPWQFLLLNKYECHYLNGTQRVRFLFREVYGRHDYAHLDSDLGKFVADREWAEPDVRRWNSDKAVLRDFMSNIDVSCPHNYGVAETGRMVGRKTSPTVTISTTKEDPASPHTQLLCTVTGFYPLEIEIKWLKNGQEEKKGVLYGEEFQNGDWTYQTQVMLDTTPEHGDVYTCRVEHTSLKTPITVQWEPRRSDSAKSKVWTGFMGFVLGVVFVAVGLSLYLKSKKATPIQQPAALIS